jgi:peptide/nickel transport system permease protein
VVDDIASRLFEIILAVPGLFVIILVVTLFGSNLITTMLVVGMWVWPSNARIMRAQVLSGKRRDYVTAATILGASDGRILLRHVIPNSLPPLIANSTLQIGFAIALEAGLSFIGLGDPNIVSWGQMLNTAQSRYATAWWMAVFPGLAISLLVLAFNLVGDAVTRVLSPQFLVERA